METGSKKAILQNILLFLQNKILITVTEKKVLFYKTMYYLDFLKI